MTTATPRTPPEPAPSGLTLPALTERVEAVSALYARKFGIERDPDWFVLKLAEEMGELTQAYLTATGRTRPRVAPETVPDGGREALAAEVADVLAHLLLLARAQGVDVERAVREKWLVWEAEVGAVEAPG
ncbi:pyrophosphatase [Oerskovia sp. NPDC056781]|uniref:pyrophosphatase n=1 Tax=Oerskovia sp. NPDC056781 TaxID=3345942 RepID=UPI00366A8D94